MDDIATLIAALSQRQRERLAEALGRGGGAAAMREREPIAIIGMAGRFPGADSPAAYWRLLCDGVDAIGEVPADRWDVDAYYDPDPAAPGKMVTRWGGFLAQVDGFDAGFFGISPREAEHMDPQQRLALELGWEALEDAGQTRDRLAGSRTGVFMGVTHFNHAFFGFGSPAGVTGYELAGNLLYSITGRLSYFLDLRGPSVALDGACSSSLVAVHMACRSLRERETDLGLAGGVNLVLHPGFTIAFSKAGAMSPDGRSKTFDAAANGFVRGEGGGVVVLKRLSDALRDGDPIHALVRGSAVQHGGRGPGYTVPNVRGQEDLFRAALADAGLAASAIGCIEPHATGTAIGDPIELAALGTVYGGPEGGACVIGSGKTNIGHLEAAAGVAGLIKAVLSLENEAVPPLLHFHAPNPHVDLGGTRFVFPTRLLSWPRGSEKRYAAVSSFGISGTLAHAVVEEAPARPATEARDEGDGLLLPLSAASEEALRALGRAHEAGVPEGPLADWCYTAAVRRTHHGHRAALTFRSREDLLEQLHALGEGRPHRGVTSGARAPGRGPRVAFVFCGQGAHWPGMGRDLLEREPVFRAAVEACDRIARPLTGWSILDELTADDARSRQGETDVAQLCLFAIQAGLWALWRSWGVEPEAVVGHSAGEVAAAYAGGVLDLEQAVLVAYHRGRLMQGATGAGRMAAVDLTAAEARALVAPHAGRLWVAAVNGPRSVVLSGEADALEAVVRDLDARGVFHRSVHERYAFHSHQMEPFAADLTASLRTLSPAPPRAAVFSTVHGGPGREADFDAAYWGRNIREPVLFADAIARMIEAGFDTFVEVGPHPALSMDLRSCLAASGKSGAVLASSRRRESTRATMLGSLGSLYVAGAPVAWERLYPRGRCVSLPAYPWQREHYRLEAQAGDPRWGMGMETAPAPSLYELRWEPAPRPRPAPGTEAKRGTWLVFADRGGMGRALAALLEADGQQCVLVTLGKTYAKAGPGRYRIHPGRREDYARVLREAFDPETSPCRGVVHLFSLDTNAKAHSPDAAIELGCESALHLVQALSGTPWKDPPALRLVTRRAQSAGVGEGSGSVEIGQAPLWGLGRVIAQEAPELRCALVDIGAGSDLRALYEELRADGADDQVALRGGMRYVARLAPLPPPAPRAPAGAVSLRADATYLVTGGLGALGLQVAAWMVVKGARHLVLAGRSKPSPMAEAALVAMRGAGAQVTALRVDVSREQALYAALAKMQRMPPLRGVVHAAGVLDDGVLLHLDRKRFRAVLAPKVLGAWNLHCACRRKPLDFFVLFSSVASVFGEVGRGSYAAASAFLDALAHHRRAKGAPALSIDWGGWEGVGMAADLRARSAQSGGGAPLLPAAQALGTLERLLGEDAPAQVVAPSFDLAGWGRYHGGDDPSVLTGLTAGQAPREPAAVPVRAALLGADPQDRRRRLESYLQELVAGTLRLPIAKVEVGCSLLELGLDSILAVEVATRAERELGVRVSVVSLLGGASVAEAAERLAGQLGAGEQRS